MDQELIQQAIQQIHAQYPWASEDTVQRIAQLSRSSSIKTTALAVAIQQVAGAADAKQLETYIKNATQDLNRSLADSNRTTNAIDKHTRNLGSSLMSKSSGLENMTELASAGSEAMNAAAHGLTDMLPGRAKAFKWAATSTTGAAVALTGIAAVFAKLISSQEKQLRAMIDLGVVMGDVDNYTEMRGQAAAFGMSLGDYQAILQQTSAVITSTSGSMIEGSGRMFRFLTDDNMVKSVKNFGYTPKETAALLADETAQLFALNEINTLGAVEQKKVINSFEGANQMGLYLADTLGVQRSAMLASRQLLRENQDYQLAFVQNTKYLNETFGDGAAARSREGADFLMMLASGTMGDTFAGQLADVIAGTTADIQFDRSAVNNMLDPQFTEMLQGLGPSVFQGVVKLIEDNAIGSIKTPEDMATRYTEILKLIKGSSALLGTSSFADDVNMAIATATTVPLAFLEGTAVEIKARLEAAQSKVDGADDSIEIVGSVSKAFMQGLHTVTPGFSSMGTVMTVMENSVGTFTDFWLDVFGSGSSSSMTDVMTDFQRDSANAYLAAPGFNVNDNLPIRTNTSVSGTLTVEQATTSVSSITDIVNKAQQEHDSLVDQLNNFEDGREVDQVQVELLKQNIIDARAKLQTIRLDEFAKSKSRETLIKDLMETGYNIHSDIRSIALENKRNDLVDIEAAIEKAKIEGETATVTALEQERTQAQTIVSDAILKVTELEKKAEENQLEQDSAAEAAILAQQRFRDQHIAIDILKEQLTAANDPDKSAYVALENVLIANNVLLTQKQAALNDALVVLNQTKNQTPATVTTSSNFEAGASLQGVMLAELTKQGITDPTAQANILAMIQGESGWQMQSERSYKNTDNDRIRSAMGNRVQHLNEFQLTQLKQNDREFFDVVYSNIGGYDYRGRGFIQLTGEQNYKLVGEMIGQDLLGNPDLMNTPEIAAQASAAYFNLPWWQKYQDNLDNMYTAYKVVYGIDPRDMAPGAAQDMRLTDIAERQVFAGEYSQALNSGKLSAANTIAPAAIDAQTKIRSLQHDISMIIDEDGDGINTATKELSNDQLGTLIALERQLTAEIETLAKLMDTSGA